MASYNNYSSLNPYLNGYNYQPTYMPSYQQRPVMPQQPMPQQPEQAQMMSPFKNVMFLNAKEVAGRIVDPNTTELFIDRDSKVAYVKSADQMGFSTTKAYRLEELTEEEQNGLSTPQKVQNLDGYVTKEAFESFTKRVSDKIGQIESKFSAKELKGE